MNNNKMNYRTLVLRFWEESSNDIDANANFRFSIGDVTTNQQVGFSDLPACIAYLQNMLDPGADAS